VVWGDLRNGNWDIYGYNLSTSTEFPIAIGMAPNSLPAIYGDTVVWGDLRNGNNWDIYWDIYGATFIPEPGALLLLAPGLLGIAGVLPRRRR
jgi:beta propeller repeat protein